MSMTRRITTGLLVLSTVLVATQAQARTWGKLHRTVNFGDQRVAEYTVILTRDGEGPAISRTLYAEGAATDGKLLVIRDTVSPLTDPTIITTTIKLLSTGETLSWTLTKGIEIIVDVNGTPAVLHHPDGVEDLPPASYVSSVNALLAARSQGFQAAIRRLAEIGTRYSPGLNAYGDMLAILFFPEYRDGQPSESDSAASAAVSNFDPVVHPPDAFDRLFGTEYSTE